MRFSAMRRAAGVALALIWGGARLAQPLQAECPHHAAAVVAQEASHQAASHPPALPAAAGHEHHAQHAHHGAEPAVAAPATPATPEHGHHTAPCECAAHCCAASVVAAPVPLPALAVTSARPASRAVVTFEASAPRALFTYRQPPATAPPTVLAV